MKEKLNRWLYYRIARLSIKAKWAKYPSSDLSDIQKNMLEITSTLISDSQSELLSNPVIDDKVGEKYYIKKTNDNGVIEKFITISKISSGYNIELIGGENIDGVKHNYHFDVWFDDKCGVKIIEKFKRVLKRRRNKMEAEIRKDDEKTLELILKNLKND